MKVCKFLFFSFSDLRMGQFKMQFLKLVKDAIAIIARVMNATAIC
jgi:hypothetical protein